MQDIQPRNDTSMLSVTAESGRHAGSNTFQNFRKQFRIGGNQIAGFEVVMPAQEIA
jgi:hypothetical protein